MSASLTSKLSAVAPEVMSSEVYGEAADIWGLGCIALEMLSLNFLWEVKGLLSIKVLTTPVAAGEMSSKFSAQVRCMLSRICRPLIVPWTVMHAFYVIQHCNACNG